ncbi:hypothetical protein BYT27DRAFT_7221402 [Phlegmacium glaucopus]|nr:hypothetical protein BYT27DRAFT_7221402 [Phlegmacium glaucopus]
MSTVEPVITHTPRWMAQAMGYYRLWVWRGMLKIGSKNHQKIALVKPMGFSSRGVWVMGYGRPMGYVMHFPAHQVGGLAELWDITGYGFSQVWVITGSTVHIYTNIPLYYHFI